MERLGEAILSLARGGGVPQEGTALLLDAWERDLLRRVRDALSRAASALSASLSPDVVVEELRLALAAAGGLTGIDAGEEVLREVFSRFCVGK
jgi:tRNA modification GTPase